jgi:hypothetical protein
MAPASGLDSRCFDTKLNFSNLPILAQTAEDMTATADLTPATSATGAAVTEFTNGDDIAIALG